MNRSTNAQQCPCYAVLNSTTAVHLKNLEARKRVRVTYRTTTVDLGTGQDIDPSDPTQLSPDLEPDEARYLGCSIVPDRTVLGTETDAEMARICRVRNRYELLGSSIVNRVSYSENFVAVEDASVTGPKFCKKQCEDNNPNCHDLGSRHAAIAAPFVSFLDAAADGEEMSYPSEQLYAQLGTDADVINCNRGDLIVTDNMVENEGDSVCFVRRSSIASLASNISNRDKLEMLWGPFDVSLEIPKTLAMTRGTGESISPGMDGRFEDASKSPAISFASSPLAAEFASEINYLNEKYSGYVRDVTYGERNDGSRIVVLSTARGCLMMDAPDS